MKQYENVCRHNKWVPMGFQKISEDETKVEVIACVICENCGQFRTKILYFDRQRDKEKSS